jgi:hypothetical protein
MIGQKQPMIHATEGPSPAREVVAQNTEQLPFTRSAFENITQINKRQLGPTDPLTGPSHPDDTAGIVHGRDLYALLEKNLLATRSVHPNMTCDVYMMKGDNPTVNSDGAGESCQFKFQVSGRPVPALALMMQNNSAQPINYNLDDPATPGSFVLGVGAVIQIAFAAIHQLYLWVPTAGTSFSGLSNAGKGGHHGGGTAAAAIAITAWSNPEWITVWGTI